MKMYSSIKSEKKSYWSTAKLIIFMTSAILLFVAILKIETAYASSDELQYIEEYSEPNNKYKKVDHMRVAVIQENPGTAQLNVTPEQAERIKSYNRERLKRYVEQAVRQGAEWVITSEMGVVGYPHVPGTPSEEENFRTREEILPYVETVPGPTTDYFSKVAKDLKIHLQVGFPEIDPATGKLYNAAVLIKPNGEIAVSHRKNSLFHVEGQYFSRGGSQAPIYESPIGKVGLLICADAYDNSLLRHYKNNGVKVLNLSTSWAQMNTGMGYFQRAATQVGAHLLAANQPYFPDSGVINPDGSKQSHIRQSSGLAFGYIAYENPAYPKCSKLFK